MRLRPLVTVSIAAASAVLLAGCSGLGGNAASPAPTSTAAVDLCDAMAPSGAASESVTVGGDFGSAPTIEFDSPLKVDELQATVLTEGDGEQTSAGDYISYALTAYGADEGDELVTLGYKPGELMPSQISAESPLGQILGCNGPGTRVVATFPATPATETAAAIAAEVYVIDVLDIVPTAAWGASQDPVDGMPVVTLAEDGTPSVEIPDADPPTETEVATLKKGDGYEVQDGDYVLIQYYGVRWSNGEVFDQTWDGTPYAAQTTGFVEGFQKALTGFPVGSQVLVVIPPAEGYGEGEINETDLKGETLVFVVDILGAQHVESE
ncbi:MAG: FKBP-type peptidyl-prolyl cis-trans isomerase [Candidatus Microbacterium phytovorans]|uniref:peptidylprolyl isomerase n=1 Tax=Candidatus Microbacterium phytovorans TaxID=3121374 RepID=A0AAJ6B5L5_9MICO|nr:FKBP-type peptidyl-prolyl cis-trans isomerase [Microbacterium sp.]WEK13941.1 MAG: FKBP-type peptidyl-prolyl cis-trans isomerase [Microbacterium sp.]